MINYKQYTKLEPSYVLKKVQTFLEEDIPDVDQTSIGIMESNEVIIAEIQVVEKLVFSGKHVIPYCFDKSKVVVEVNDGDELMPGDIIGTIEGSSQYILSRERIMLNLIQRMCGIASQTREYFYLAQPYGIKILDTRKTTPGLRLFEKYAVKCGGGFNHRLSLSDGILIKDNHIKAAGSVKKAVESVRINNSQLKIELEVDTFGQIKEGLEMDVDGFLLDNMSPTQIQKSLKMIRSYSNKNHFVEASGGISLKNIKDYLKTKVDAISVGALTHQVQSKDIRLEFRP